MSHWRETDMHAIATWRKSSYSGSEGGNCIEVDDECTGVVPIRDSKNPEGPTLRFTATAWVSFLSAIHAGEFPVQS
ncbi:DUF397 domain-containing protein [Kitasatospora purpeofusca]|uniref:DUF397 domain-containing protein n=1 Tax=Kitasatospora purpeofusca TaxID=67352 RepID=UPI00056138DD|nr:DUF397 domain-containing protein [Kitasatospora purpeofusca]